MYVVSSNVCVVRRLRHGLRDEVRVIVNRESVLGHEEITNIHDSFSSKDPLKIVASCQYWMHSCLLLSSTMHIYGVGFE